MHNGGRLREARDCPQSCDPAGLVIPRLGPVCRAMYPVPVLIDSADQSVTESQDDSQKTLTEWVPVEHVGANSESTLPVPSETRIVERTSFPLEIRIGPERHGYVYTLHFPSGVYRCQRGSDWANDGDRLFLCKETSGWPPRP